MEKKSFNNKKLKQYKNKWCLYRKYSSDDYARIFVVDIKDGIIMSYNDIQERYEYTPVDKYEYGEFFVSPFNQKSPLEKDDTSRNIDPRYNDWKRNITVPSYPQFPAVDFPKENPKI